VPFSAEDFVFSTKYGDSAVISKKERSIALRTNCPLRTPVSAILLAFFLLPPAAHAKDASVGCGGVNGTYDFTTITDALNNIGQTGPSTITVTGTCQENVSLNNARSITIVAGPSGATIVGPLDTDAFDISLSQDINLVNLEISGTFSTTGNGGGTGVFITEASDVHIAGCNIHDNQSGGVGAETDSILFLRNTTIQNNTPGDGLDLFDNSTADVARTTIQNNGDSAAGGVGVFLTGMSTVVFRQTNLIQNNADFGIQAVNVSHVRFQSAFTGLFTTVQGHNVNGILVRKQSHLQIGGASPQVIQGNGAACPLDPTCGGILVDVNSTVHVDNGTISGNHGSGISAEQGANVRLSGATVSNNSGDGVHLKWISIGDFISGNTITGNGGASVFCDERSLALGDLSAFSKVRCGEIEPENGHHHSDKDKESHR
jgi:parallel beta helix pectate lyase-like protein